MNSNSNICNKSVLIENENKNNSEQKSYGSINNTTNDKNITNLSSDQNSGNGWLSKASSGVYSVGAGAVTYGWGGLKWALESTASVGTTVVSAGAEGVVRLKNRATKDKNE